MGEKTSRSSRALVMAFLGPLWCGVPAVAVAAVIVVPDDNPSLAAAVENAAPGDTIRVRPGTYAGRVRIERGQTGLTLEGLGGRPVIVPDPADDGVRIREVDGVTIRGIEVRGGQRAVRIDKAASTTVEDVVGIGNKEGLRARKTVSLVVRGCELRGALRGRGVRIDVATTPLVVDTRAADNHRDGIRMLNVVEPTVRGSTASGNRGEGIRLVRARSVVLEGNRAEGNGRSGIRADLSPGLTIRDNEAHANLEHGFRVRRSPPVTMADDLVAAGNVASGNGLGEFRVD